MGEGERNYRSRNTNGDSRYGKSYIKHTYESDTDSGKKIFIFSTITFQDKPNYIVYVFELTREKDFKYNYK